MVLYFSRKPLLYGLKINSILVGDYHGWFTSKPLRASYRIVMFGI